MTILRTYPRASAAVAIIVLLIAGVRLLDHGRSTPLQKLVLSFYADLTLQAQEVTYDLDEGAGVVVLVFDGEVNAGAEKNFERLYESLEKKGLSILHVERLVFDPEKGWDPYRLGIPYREFLRVAESYPQADAFLSLCGVPYGLDLERSPSPDVLPDLLVTRVREDMEETLDLMLKEGWVQMAVVRNDHHNAFGSNHSYKVLHAE